MDLFRRKKKEPPPPPVEEGHANLAKQVRYAAPSATLVAPPPTARPTLTAAQTGTKTAPAQTLPKSDEPFYGDLSKPIGTPIYQFETTAARSVERSRRWYIGTSIFFSVLIAINIVMSLYMSAVVILFAALLLFMIAARKPEKLSVKFFGNGLGLNAEFHPWSEFEKFWILFEPPVLKRLHLQRRARIINELTIELANENPLKIRDLLLPWLPEDPTKEESRVDLVSRTLKW